MAYLPSRRDLMRLGALALTLSSARAQGPASDIARGRVYDLDTGAGLAGVMVSNGCDVVQTGDDGAYAIEAPVDGSIFVIKPDHWSAPVDPVTMLPRIHHLHQPKGTPAHLSLRHAGVKPTGALPESLDFGLRHAPEPLKFDVVMLADPQPADDAEIGYFREQIVSPLSGVQAAFGLTLGDVMGDNLSLYERYNRVVAQIGLPWWNLPGNHDLNLDAPHGRFGRESWKRVFGPTTYAFEYGGATFVMFDNVEWPGRGQRYSGYLGEGNLAFLRNLLAHTPRDRLVVLCMHIPLMSAADPNDPGSNTRDRDALLSLISGRPCVSFAGHMHTTEHHYLPLPGGDVHHHHHVLTAASGSWWSGPQDARGLPLAQSCDGTPNGWHMLSVDSQSYRTRFVSAREPMQMRIMLEDRRAGAAPNDCLFLSRPVARSRLGEVEIVVNIFDGGPRTQVEACVNGCAPSTMRREMRPDPMTRDLFARAGETRKPWVQAEPSSHLWAGALPSEIAPGVHRLTVKARNEYGETITGALVFEVASG